MKNTDTPAAAPALVLRRTYAAPRQRVFDAWTKPELAMKFFGPAASPWLKLKWTSDPAAPMTS